jgi:hypothetical protein
VTPQIQQYIQAALALLGAFYVIFSVLGALAPNTKFGRFCTTVAADIRGLFPPAPPTQLK